MKNMRHIIAYDLRAWLRHRAAWALLLGALLLVGSGLVAYAQTGAGYDLTWWTLDAGGETGIRGGDYLLLGTAGQPDAVLATNGGQYTLLSGFWPGEQDRRRGTLYLPLILRSYGHAPDLIGAFSLSPDKSNYNTGEPVVVTAVVTNQGDSAAGPFWVDFYTNPSRPPAVNLRWNDICGISPCYGLAWYVSGGLAPGQSVTLTSEDYPPGYSIWPGYLPSGATDLYLYVDVWNPTVPSGAIAESDENNNLSERHGLTVTGLTTSGASPDPAGLPPRPLRLPSP
jgi:hypothetical protein